MSEPTVTIEARDLKWLIERANGHPNPTRESDRRLDDLGLALAVPAEPGEPLYRRCERCEALRVKRGAELIVDRNCLACGGERYIPAVAPVPPDGIAGVLQQCMDQRLPVALDWVRGVGHVNVPQWRAVICPAETTFAIVAEAADPLSALQNALAKADGA